MDYYDRDIPDTKDSILLTIKQLLGVYPVLTNDAFDTDLIIHINSVFSILHQLGIGPSEGFAIKDYTDLWTDFLSDSTQLEFVKSYMYAKVKKLFDPPTSASLMNSLDSLINEFEWRENVAVDPEQW